MKLYRTIIQAAILVAAVLALLAGGTALAQEQKLRLSISKIWGFSAGGRLQGRMNLAATGPSDLVSVTFKIDGQDMGTASQAPFTLAFDTGSYPSGVHTLSALGRTSGGQELTSDPATAEFLSGAQAYDATLRIAVPLIGLVLVVMAIGMGGTILMAGRNKQRMAAGAPRVYGIAGGAICPKCSRPYARSLFGLNLFGGKLERCPYCGKWSIVRKASTAQLAAAEAAEQAAATPNVPELSEEEKLRRQIEGSRFQQ